MLYLFLSSMVMFVTVISLHKHTLTTMDSLHDSAETRPNALAPLTSIVVTGAFCAPLLALLASVLFAAPEEGVPLNHGRTQIYFLLIGSLAFLVMGLFAARAAWIEKKFGFWTAGRLTVFILAGVVGSLSAYKHLTFFSSEKDGVANVGLLREIADLNDMDQCISGIALVQFSESGPLSFRCPTTILFNRDAQQPFAPWPDYIEGKSQKLADAVKTISEAAERGHPVQAVDQ